MYHVVYYHDSGNFFAKIFCEVSQLLKLHANAQKFVHDKHLHALTNSTQKFYAQKFLHENFSINSIPSIQKLTQTHTSPLNKKLCHVS